jgi:hypothetical protein
MKAKLEQMPTLRENTINNEVQPVVKEQLEKAANELPPPLADKLPQESGTLSNELEQLIEEAQPADPEEKVAVVQDALDKVLYEDRYSHWMPSMGRATAEAIDAGLG